MNIHLLLLDLAHNPKPKLGTAHSLYCQVKRHHWLTTLAQGHGKWHCCPVGPDLHCQQRSSSHRPLQLFGARSTGAPGQVHSGYGSCDARLVALYTEGGYWHCYVSPVWVLQHNSRSHGNAGRQRVHDAESTGNFTRKWPKGPRAHRGHHVNCESFVGEFHQARIARGDTQGRAAQTACKRPLSC
ncbi:hypothetical protein EJF18_50087 [Clavispora lusitaniae]|uniref:Uncharacterized protein n=1 Tax=Clavispora lusitaniae TaxID=36911 RepID=A0ACD0WNK9_CLALS|nr:hypothetical protein EJF14_50087 [Clavispora lusitaniae]QFZ34533.1 hypothetical protein EJF16_50087 [Clavispora lusitaniae]QFZ40218.1 hypothetical protein EJF15_50087 [Clavispora lusitaniae]QFZ45898.1 hypothetical protein EJF18_50087 [Clavispora lusitaniae]QFZ51560.1 hypothetical protein EJF17_50087 [Clavispora lusitaniae]